MECPYCGHDSRVTDSRKSGDGIRRRRECLDCGRRFTTYERLEAPEIRVLKRDGSGEKFDPDKLRAVVRRLTRGRPVGVRAGDDLVRGLEAKLLDDKIHSITSGQLAERLLERLGELDATAATRFASNYRQEDGTLKFAEDSPSPQMLLPILAAPADDEEEPVRARAASEPPAPSPAPRKKPKKRAG